MNALRDSFQLSLICCQKEILSVLLRVTCRWEALHPAEAWWCCAKWWATQGGLTVGIHLHGMGCAPSPPLCISFLGLLGMG